MGIYYVPSIVLIALQILTLLIRITGILCGKGTRINFILEVKAQSTDS